MALRRKNNILVLSTPGAESGDALVANPITQFAGVTTVGAAVANSTNPSAVTFLRANADNTVTWLSAGDTRTSLGVGTGDSPVFTGVGIGTGATTPSTVFHVATSLTTSPRGIMSSQHNTGTDGARLHMRKSRGTLASPTVIVTGDNLGRIVGTGFDGTSFLEMAAIVFGTSGTIAATRVPTNIQFHTATDAAPSVLTERMRIKSDGAISIPSTNTAGLQAHNVVDQETNYERGVFRFTSNALQVGTEFGGTGTGRNLVLGVASSAGTAFARVVTISPNIPFYTTTYTTGSAGYGWQLSINGTGASVAQGVFSLLPTYNQSGTSAGTDFLINRTETALGSGAHRFCSFQVSNVEKFAVGNGGRVAVAGSTLSTSTALIVPAGTTAQSSLRIPHGAAPTSPVDGDEWSTTAGRFCRINGVTKTYTLT